MLEIILTKGIPASGKSTWAKKVVNSNRNFKRVNKDELRAMLDCSLWSVSNEKFVLDIRDYIVREAIRKNINVIVDDTNFEEKHFQKMCEIAESFNKDITVYEIFFACEIETAIIRDIKREKSLGEKVVRRFYDQYVYAKSVTEQSAVFYSKIEEPPTNIISNLPKAIICDLDGTLALLNGRSPYDASTCNQDLINQSVRDVLKAMYEKGYEIIFVSGREDKYIKSTEEFLHNHLDEETWGGCSGEGETLIVTPFKYQLHMRKTDDFRKDSIIKREIYDQYIKNNYEVAFVLDDRPQVVRMWRYDLGLTVFQLNDKEF